MSTRCGRWIYIFCFLLICGFAQQSGHAGQSQPPALVPLAIANRQITLDVVVTDKSGKQVPGLQQQDFALLDNKQRQEILSFRAVKGGIATADPPVEVILLVDEVNSTLTQVGYERGEIEKYLRQNGGELSHPVSLLFVSDSGMKSGITSSQDGNAVIADLNQEKTGLRTNTRSQGFYGAIDRTQMSLNALEQLAQQEATKPGRKIVVWISPGWPFPSGAGIQMSSKDQQSLFINVVAYSDGLRRARITLYDVDPLGLEDAGGFRTNIYKGFLKGVRKAEQVQVGNLALQVLASQSGGQVFNSSNDVSGEVGACVADANAFYVLTFNGLPGDGPNDYHALDIKIDKPGLKARTRAGYYAQPDR